eukprot:jgi/Galph1/4213/GphlegSOOS_G2832.1
MKFYIQVDIQTTKENFWKYRSHPKFLQLQVEEGQLDKLETVEEGTKEDGTCYRKMHIYPKLELFEGFKVLKRYVQENFAGLEDYQWWKEDNSYVQFFRTKPLGLLQDAVITEGRMDLQDTGATCCQYVLQGEVHVHIIGVGHLAEPIIVHNLKTFYEGKFCEIANKFFSQYRVSKDFSVQTNREQEMNMAANGRKLLRIGNLFHKQRKKNSFSAKVKNSIDNPNNEKEEEEEYTSSQEEEIKVVA